MDQLRAILSDFHDAGLEPGEVAIMDFAQKIARSANEMTQADVDALRALGLEDVEILDITLTATMRCFASKTFNALEPCRTRPTTNSNASSSTCCRREVAAAGGEGRRSRKETCRRTRGGTARRSRPRSFLPRRVPGPRTIARRLPSGSSLRLALPAFDLVHMVISGSLSTPARAITSLSVGS